MFSKTADGNFKFDNGKLYQVFKYTLYAFLTMNVYHFFVDDQAASTQVFANGIAWGDFIQAYTATIDTAAWVLLLLLFELETFILDDDKIKGGLKWSMNVVRVVCYAFIIYSFFGYLIKFSMFLNASPLQIADACGLVGGSFTYLSELDEYLPFSNEMCGAYNSVPLLQLVATEIISLQDNLVEARQLALVDVVNSATWLLVVLILEVEVFLQLRGDLTDRFLAVVKWFKIALYSILLLAAIYWGVKGSLIDFWDAFLWLLAFAFIELNIFEWNVETRENEQVIKQGATTPGV